MAKSSNFLFVICCSVLWFSGCLPKTDVVTDTPPDEAKSHAVYIPQQNDSTYSVVITQPKKVGEKIKRDTVKREAVSKPVKSFEQLATEVRKVYTSQIGIMEKTGHNDGPGPKKWLGAVGLTEGYAYCSAGVAWTFMQVGYKTTITAYSPSSVNYKNLVYAKGKEIKEPHFSDVVSFYYPYLGRIGHTGFYDGRVNETVVITVEFNTSGYNDAVDREGEGVFRKKRPIRTITYISRWLPG